VKKCNCDTCHLCKSKASEERHSKIGFWGITIVLAFTVLLLATSLGSCSPQRKFLKLVKNHPELIDSVSKSDTVHVVDSVTIRTTNYIRETEIDSIIVDCPDEVKPKIREQIKSKCTIESILNGAHIFRLINGTGVLTATGNDLHLRFDTESVRTETTYYYPNEKCEEDKKVMLAEFKKIKRDSLMTGIMIGGLGMLFLILVIVALVKWGFR